MNTTYNRLGLNLQHPHFDLTTHMDTIANLCITDPGLGRSYDRFVLESMAAKAGSLNMC